MLEKRISQLPATVSDCVGLYNILTLLQDGWVSILSFRSVLAEEKGKDVVHEDQYAIVVRITYSSYDHWKNMIC